jgi:Arc/MetJ family transcription regulator
MFIYYEIMNIKEKIMSTTTRTRKNKHFLLDQARLEKAQKVLGTRTETETVEVALERIVTEAEENEKAWAAQEKFLKSAVKDGLTIEDVFGRLGD